MIQLMNPKNTLLKLIMGHTEKTPDKYDWLVALLFLLAVIISGFGNVLP